VATDNAQVMRELFESFNRRDLAATAPAVDELVVWDARQIPVPDLHGVYQGIAGATDFWRRWLPMWEHVSVEVLWMKADGARVWTWVRQTQVGRESGAETKVDYGWDVTFQDGRIIRVSFFDNEERAGAPPDREASASAPADFSEGIV